MINVATCRARVFQLMPHRNDVSAAEAWGDLVQLFEAGEPRPGIWSPDLAEEALLRLADHGYDPRRDWVLVDGSMVAVVSFLTALVQRYPAPRALMFDRVQGGYVEKPLGLPAAAVVKMSPNSIEVRR